jgi:hypothetical protein
MLSDVTEALKSLKKVNDAFDAREVDQREMRRLIVRTIQDLRTHAQWLLQFRQQGLDLGGGAP